MTDDDLVAELEDLGIDAKSYKLLALLPLVRVAWADGVVQRAERDLIRAIAEKKGLADAHGMSVLDGWLAKEPSAWFHTRASRALTELATRSDAHVTLDTLDEVLAWCEGVATAAGGLFGFGSVDASEREAIAQIGRALNASGRRSWAEVKGGLG